MRPADQAGVPPRPAPPGAAPPPERLDLPITPYDDPRLPEALQKLNRLAIRYLQRRGIPTRKNGEPQVLLALRDQGSPAHFVVLSVTKMRQHIPPDEALTLAYFEQAIRHLTSVPIGCVLFSMAPPDDFWCGAIFLQSLPAQLIEA
jgi:hypothetical protein